MYSTMQTITLAFNLLNVSGGEVQHFVVVALGLASITLVLLVTVNWQCI